MFKPFHAAPAAIIALLTGAALAPAEVPVPPGRYNGTWTNTTTNATGVVRLDLWNIGRITTANLNTIQARLDFDGSIVGASEPQPVNLILSPAGPGTWQGQRTGHPQLGTVTMIVTAAGQVQLGFADLPAGSTAGSFAALGTLTNLGALNLNGSVVPPGSGTTSQTVGVALTRGIGTALFSPNRTGSGLFGTCVAGLSDLDGDGVGELLVGAVSEVGAGNIGAGRVYVISGRTGLLIYEVTDPSPQPSGFFGSAVALVGDVNGDGRGDFVVSATGYNAPGAPNAGRAYLYSAATGALIAVLQPNVPRAAAQFGWSVAGVPDADGDNIPDVAVGAPFFARAGAPSAHGRVFLFKGGNLNGGPAQILRVIDPPTPATDGYFGLVVMGSRDLTGDNRGDLVIGEPRGLDGALTGGVGRFHVFSGAAGTLVRTTVDPEATPDGLYGSSLAPIPDLNGDPVTDLLVGAPHHTVSGQFRAGRAYAYSGSNGTLIRPFVSPNPVVSGRFGQSVAALPDLTGDSRSEIVVAARNEGPVGGGRIYLFSGNNAALIRAYGSHFATDGGRFGWSMARVADTDGDGRPDLVVGAPSETVTGFGAPLASGAAYILRIRP